MTDFDLFDLVLKNWTRPVYEATGYKIIPVDTGYQIVLNVLGIKEKDITIKVDRGVLSVSGKTENELIKFTNSVNYKFNIQSIKNDLEEIKYEAQDGLMILTLALKEPKENKVKITRK
jgi:HSP20 family molecular chaperone IbpA